MVGTLHGTHQNTKQNKDMLLGLTLVERSLVDWTSPRPSPCPLAARSPPVHSKDDGATEDK